LKTALAHESCRPKLETRVQVQPRKNEPGCPCVGPDSLIASGTGDRKLFVVNRISCWYQRRDSRFRGLAVHTYEKDSQDQHSNLVTICCVVPRCPSFHVPTLYHFFPTSNTHLSLSLSLSDTSHIHTHSGQGVASFPDVSPHTSFEPAKKLWQDTINTGKRNKQHKGEEGEAVIWDPRVMTTLN
jgi:hypothetical protein